MKFTTAILALPLAVSARGVLDTRQLKAAPVAGVEKLEPRIRPGAKRTLTKFGPFELKAATAGGKAGTGMGGMGGMGSMGGGHDHDNTLTGTSYFLNINKGFCNDESACTVYGGKVGVLFADGSKADPSKGVYIHHVLTTDRTKKVTNFLSACDNPNRPGMSVSSLGTGTGFVGTGEDSGDRPVMYTQRDGKSDAGYWIEKGDNFLANVELVNYNKEAKQVFITYDLEYAPGKVGVNTKGMLISVTQCPQARSIKLSNTGPTNSTSGKFTFLESGSIVAARGHLHDGGVQMDLFINKKYVCSSQATYGGDGSTSSVNGQEWKTISSMSYCDGPIRVKKGDTLSINGQYDLKRYPLRKGSSGAEATGVMAMFSITFAPEK